MEIYAERLFLINFSALFLCLLPSVHVCGIRFCRHAAASAAGAAFASAAFASDGATAAVLTLLGYTAASLIAFGPHIRGILIFLTTVLLMYAAVTLEISFFKNSAEIILKNGVMYFDISPPVFAAVFLISLPAVTALDFARARLHRKSKYTLTIFKNGRTASVTALYDSGNLLRDPKTKRQVILVCRNELEELDTDGILTSEAPVIIPYRSLGHSGAVIGFVPDKIMLDGNKEINNAVIGISEERFADGCGALIGGI